MKRLPLVLLLLLLPTTALHGQNTTFKKWTVLPAPIGVMSVYVRQAEQNSSREACVASLAEQEATIVNSLGTQEYFHQDYASVDARWLVNPTVHDDSYPFGWQCLRGIEFSNGVHGATLYKAIAVDRTRYAATRDAILDTMRQFGSNTSFIGWGPALGANPDCTQTGSTWTCTAIVTVKTE